TLRALGSISGWLLAVVRRECFRMAMRAMGKPDNLNDALLNPANVDRLAHLSQDELRLDLSRAIQSLPEHYRAFPSRSYFGVYMRVSYFAVS
ncbi:hypothetical protein ACC722_38440, partial [Rhizobium ruizarguesonis]